MTRIPAWRRRRAQKRRMERIYLGVAIAAGAMLGTVASVTIALLIAASLV